MATRIDFIIEFFENREHVHAVQYHVDMEPDTTKEDAFELARKHARKIARPGWWFKVTEDWDDHPDDPAVLDW